MGLERFEKEQKQRVCAAARHSKLESQQDFQLLTRTLRAASIAGFYFQLQFGMKLLPVVVSCFCSLPSASIDQIWVLPPMVRSKTMWRLSGDHEG